MKIIDKFIRIHQVGQIPETCLLRDILENLGCKFTESTVFGLGNGLIVNYYSQRGTLTFFNPDFVEDLVNVLNFFHFEKRYYGPLNEIFLIVKNIFEYGPFGVGPYPVYVEIGLNSQTETMIIIGISEEHYFCIRNDCGDVVKIKFEELSREVTYVNYHIFEAPQKLPSTRRMLAYSLYNLCHNFLFFGNNKGAKALEKYRNDLIKFQGKNFIGNVPENLDIKPLLMFYNFLLDTQLYFEEIDMNQIIEEFLTVCNLMNQIKEKMVLCETQLYLNMLEEVKNKITHTFMILKTIFENKLLCQGN